MLPSDIHPGLTAERLEHIGALLADARDRAQRDAKPHEGDDAWSTGCVAYSRSRAALTDAAAETEWLTVIQAGMEYVFAVDGVPLRFCRNDEDKLSKRQGRVCASEWTSLSQLLLEGVVCDGFFRMRVQVDGRGCTQRVYLVRADAHDNLLNQWAVWEAAAPAELPEPLEQAPPAVFYDPEDDADAAEGSEAAGA